MGPIRLLKDFHPQWIGLTRPAEYGEGVQFDCPVCGPTHALVVYFSNPLDDKDPAPWQNPTWKRIGTAFEELTIKPSIKYPCFHGWVERGRVFLMSEAPINVLAMVNGKPQIVGLSPEQCLEALPTVIDQARKMLE